MTIPTPHEGQRLVEQVNDVALFLSEGGFALKAAEMRQAAAALFAYQQEVERLRETNTRLNRRCQLAETAVNANLETKRGKSAANDWVFELARLGVAQDIAEARQSAFAEAASAARFACCGAKGCDDPTCVALEALGAIFDALAAHATPPGEE